MNYKLNTSKDVPKGTLLTALARLVPLMAGERRSVVVAAVAILLNSGVTLAAPALIAYIVDHFLLTHNYAGVMQFSLVLVGLYLVGLVAAYVQTLTMGRTGRRVLFALRNSLFTKLQELPIAFFYQNKAGDLISRINNDTDRLNQFFAQALMQFIGNVALIAGSGVFLLVLNWRLGVATLIPAACALIITQLISPWVQRKNLTNMQSQGGMSAEVQESLEHFKVVVAFNRADYFRTRFDEVNQKNYRSATVAGVANNIFTPIYGLSYNVAQVVVLVYGLSLVHAGVMTIGLLVAFLLYANSFYNPLRQLASVWASLQQALAGLDRISEVLSMRSDMQVLDAASWSESHSASGAAQSDVPVPVISFKDVVFGYVAGNEVLHHVSFDLLPGKTYAFVGPTGGGKTTTASLMARLYDAAAGAIYLRGEDIRSLSPSERADKIGFILQEPFLFSGTVGENISYGNTRYAHASAADLAQVLAERGLEGLLERFPDGLGTVVATSGDAMSLGQKQIIAFLRAVLREPELLILDEATANIDTVTEQVLEDILQKLPATTTKVIIAHRLNTISAADDIFFVNAGSITRAGSLEHAVDLLLHNKRQS